MHFLTVLTLFLLWAAAWTIGGYLIAHAVFHLRRERTMVGFAIGLVLQLWFSNWMAHLLPVPHSFWAGAGIVFLFGLFIAWPSLQKDWRTFDISWLQIIAFGLLVYVFYSIGRGLDIFDDFQNVTTTSIMGAGDIPPHFPFAPKLVFGYHYLLLLFGAQLMRIADMFPWSALDMARAVSLSLLLMLVYLWTRRITRSQLAAWLGAIFVAFASGTRWLLLLLPARATQSISANITLIGSGASTASDLAAGLLTNWKIEGDGPIPFPFAYANGIHSPTVMALGGIGALDLVIFLLLIMLFGRLRDFKSGFVLTALFAAYALSGEYTYLIMFPSLGLVLLIHWIRARRFPLPRSLLATLAVAATSLVFVSIQGGVLTEILRGKLTSARDEGSFHTFNFSLSMPSLVSGHLGFLSLLNPAQLVAALFEIGPVILALPGLFLWGFKMLRARKWWEAGVSASAALGIFSLFVKYAGTAGQSANVRLLATFIIPPTFYAAPLAWVWLKKRGEPARIAAAALALVTVFGGLQYFGIQMIAAQKPVLPLFITALDVQMEKRYWNRLPHGGMVFDSDPRRAVTVFGRSTDAMVAWKLKPEWEALLNNPDPYILKSAGYDFIYFGGDFWQKLTDAQQKKLQDTCVKAVDEVEGVRGPNDARKDFRRLLDISSCQSP
ncbi:MAG: hypothetical protein M5U11_04380 [Anaerolineales bacterium]|nr:hypothetical protein [Anaerolineales bacterium]GER78245.1 conserved hypothetical protein [Candidatus Denitrolinea symbiosum]